MNDSRAKIQDLKEKVKDFCDARNWDRYHKAKDLAIGIITESSELLEHFRFKSESESEALLRDPKKRQAICEELVDVLFPLLRFAERYDIDLTTEMAKKMKKNEAKYPLHKT